MKERHRMGAQYVLASRGEKPAVLYDGDKFYYQPSMPVRVVDTLGAGDSFLLLFDSFSVSFSRRREDRTRRAAGLHEAGSCVCSQKLYHIWSGRRWNSVSGRTYAAERFYS